MSRDTMPQQCQVLDLFDRNDSAGDANQGAAANDSPKNNSKAANHINEDMWTGTRKRHCDSRDHFRYLLDRHLKPHN